MADRLKIDGNFLVIFEDGVPANESLRASACDTVFFVSSANDLTFYAYSPEIVENNARNQLNQDPYDASTIIDDRTGIAWPSVDELKTFLSRSLKGLPQEEEREQFYFSRVETISNVAVSFIDYWTTVQGGTEIIPDADVSGGNYKILCHAVCTSTSTNGRINVDMKIDGVSTFSVPFQKEPKDTNDRFYYSASKRVPLSAGVRTFTLDFSSDGSGSAEIFEANLIIEKL